MSPRSQCQETEVQNIKTGPSVLIPEPMLLIIKNYHLGATSRQGSQFSHPSIMTVRSQKEKLRHSSHQRATEMEKGDLPQD